MNKEDDREWLSGLKWAALALSFGFVGWMVRGEGKGLEDLARGVVGSGGGPLAADA